MLVTVGAILRVLAAFTALQGADPVPLIDLVDGDYRGFEGGLYPGGSNQPPPVHLEAALARARAIRPLDRSGRPDPGGGAIVLLSIGPSGPAQEFGRFERQEDANPLRHPSVIVLNGAAGGQTLELMTDPAAEYWERLDARLAAAGASSAQVQVVWMRQRRASVALAWQAKRRAKGEEVALDPPARQFPERARELSDDLERVVRILHTRFPNLALCYVSDRPYAGYGRSREAEPRGFEVGLAVRWLIERQIGRAPELEWNPERGPVQAPLLLFGPYLWAAGPQPNGQGTQWFAEDFEPDSIAHPSASGEQKVANLLSAFFATDPTARPWFANPGATPQLVIEARADAFVDGSGHAHGRGATLEWQQGDPPAMALVQFDLTGVRRPVRAAKLSLRNPAHHASYYGPGVFVVADDDWDEDGPLHLDAARLGAAVGRIPRSSRDATRTLDVTAAINAHPDAMLTLALAAGEPTEGPSPVLSRESGRGPRLVLTEGEGPAFRAASACRAVVRAQGRPSATRGAGFLLRVRALDGAGRALHLLTPAPRRATAWGSRPLPADTAPHGHAIRFTREPELGACASAHDVDLNAVCADCPDSILIPGAAVRTRLWHAGPPGLHAPSNTIEFAVEH